MNIALALAQILIPMIPLLVGDVESLVNWITSIRSAAQQTNEWTAKMEADFRANVLAAGLTDPAFRPDPTLEKAGLVAEPPAGLSTHMTQTKSPVTDSGANGGATELDKQENAAAADVPPYLADGSPNPAFDHVAGVPRVAATS